MDSGWIRRDDPRWGPPPEYYDVSSSDTTFADGLDEPVSPASPSPVDLGWLADQDSDLTRRVAALGRFARVVGRYVAPADVPGLAEAAELASRADVRLALAGISPRDRIGGHTVVALAGSTGVGKSSLFNALARMELSAAGHLRPTTGEAHACVWDQTGSDPILNWLRVAPRRRFIRESPLDAEDEARMRGLVLLDLPDMDSIAAGNRVEAERLVGVADRVIWVLDPQKYADASVHEQYLRHMGALRDATVVVFNQSDRLGPSDAASCRADLARLVEADGLAGVPVIATSTTTGEGIDELRELLAGVVAGRRGAVTRIEAELAESVERLAPVSPESGPSENDVSLTAVPELAAGLAGACGVAALAADAAHAHRSRSALWLAPWRVESLPAVPPADPAAISASLRRLADRVSGLLPEPWPPHLRAAATASRVRLPDDLAAELAKARGASPVLPLWTALRAAWWLCLGLGVSSLAISTVDSSPWLTLGLTCAGLALGLPLLASGTGAWRSARYRRVIERRLRFAALTVAREVVAPVRQVLRDYRHAHEALVEATPVSPRRLPSRLWS